MHPTSTACAAAPWRARLTAATGLCLSLSLGIGAAAFAQPAAPRPDPLDPQAQVPPARHESVLQRHRGSAAEVKVGDWKAANDTVTRIGGWRTYLREAAQPDAPASAPPASSAPAAAPAPAPTSAPPTGSPRGPHRH